MQALFLLKQKQDPYSSYSNYTDSSAYVNGDYGNYQAATGMWTSSKMVVDVLLEHDISAGIELVQDANSIDSIVTFLDPQRVFIEGLWVTPSKMQELLAIPAHQTRIWTVRIHSDMPFLATEGVAFEWIQQYLELGVKIAPNSQRLYTELSNWMILMGKSQLEIDNNLLYLPNCYPIDFRDNTHDDYNLQNKEVINIACFGAIRVMKNHLMQAYIAAEFAKRIGKKLRFHYNENIGSGGAGPRANMISFFDSLPEEQFELVPHEWEDRDTFMQSLSQIDILLQLSLSETMNIVAADATCVGKPVIVSDEIFWAFPLYGHPTNSEKTLEVLNIVYNKPQFFVSKNREGLENYARTSESIWIRYFIETVDVEQLLTDTKSSTDSNISNCCGR